MKRLIVGILSLAAMTACQTMVTPHSNAVSVPNERIYARPAHLSQNPATIVVVRDSGLLGAGRDKRFYVDDELIAAIAPGEKLEFKLDAGDYIFSTHIGPASNVLGNTPAYLDQRVEAGKTYYYRLYSDIDKPGQIGRVTPKALGIGQ